MAPASGVAAVSAALVSAAGGVAGAASVGVVSAEVVAGAVSAGALGVSVVAAGASVSAGAAGAVSAGVAMAGAASAGALDGVATTGAATTGAGVTGAGATGFGVAAGFAGGTVLDLAVAAGAVCGVAALVTLVADLPGAAAGLSKAFNFCSKAARAAAWTGVSSARTEMRLAQKAAAQTAGNNFMICIPFFTPICPWMQQLSRAQKTIFPTSAATGKTTRNAA